MNTTHDRRTIADNFLIMACIVAGLGLVGCQDEGSAEKAGKKLDKAAAQLDEKMDQATEKASDKLDDAKREAQKNAEVSEEYIDDVMITLKVKSALAGDLILRDSHIETTTVNGVVTLNGTVDSEQSLGRAMELANAQEHVKSVSTNLLVKTPAKGK